MLKHFARLWSARIRQSSILKTHKARRTATNVELISRLESRTLLSAGAIDPSFGTGGTVFTDIIPVGSTDTARAIVQLDDGRLVVVGTANSSSVALAFYDADGGPAGIAVTDFSALGYNIVSIDAAAEDGAHKIVVVGTVNAPYPRSDTDFLVARFNDDGSLDSSFDVDGVVTTNFTTDPNSDPADRPNSNEAHAVVIDSTHRIIAAGIDLNQDYSNFAVVRYNNDGSLDTGFGGSGHVIIPFQLNPHVDIDLMPILIPSFDVLHSVALQDDGKIVLAGSSIADFPVSSNQTFALMRLNADGSLDDGTLNDSEPLDQFGPDGIVRIDGVVISGGIVTTAITSFDSISSVVVDVDGTIVVGGSAYADFALARYEPDGDLDASFGGGAGYVTTAVPSPYTFGMINDVAIEADGKIVAAGLAAGSATDFAVARYESDGDADTSFDGDGFNSYVFDTVNNVSGAFDGAVALTLEDIAGEQKLVVAGSATNDLNSSDLVLARFDLDIALSSGSATADAGGPYDVNEGGSVQLTGTAEPGGGSTVNFIQAEHRAETAPGGGGDLTLEWDFDYDGFNFDVDDSGESVTFSAASLDGPGSRTVAFRATPESGPADISTALVTIHNVTPHNVSAGADQSVFEGALVNLSGAFEDFAGDTHTYNWHVVPPNSQDIPDGTGQNFSFTPVDEGDYTITFTVTDDDLAPGSDVVVVHVANKDPEGSVLGPASGVRLDSLSYSASSTDDGSTDVPSYAWQVLDSGSFVVATGGDVTNFTFVPTSAGSFTVRMTVTDGDGGSDIVDTSLTVVASQIVSGTVGVGGTNVAEVIFVKQRNDGKVEVKINGATVGLYTGVARIVIHGGDGDDTLMVEQGMTVPVDVYGGNGADSIRTDSTGDFLFGEAGNDTLRGRDGSDVLVGGDDDDLIGGGDGADILIGGMGADRIVGNNQDDILIAGPTSHDTNHLALEAIQAEWTSGRPYETKVANLRGTGSGDRENGSVFLRAEALNPLDVTVFDDGVKDTLNGDAGRDWFLFNSDAGVKDKIADLSVLEFGDDLDLVL